MKRILVIEDNQEVRENIAEILELSGYETDTAQNGKIGVANALAKKPDLILCDVMMPELDGFGVLRILGKNDSTRDVPFIFLTAKSEKEDFRKGMGLGADDYITKPFDDVMLLDAIDMRLQKSSRLKQSFDSSDKGLRTFFREVSLQTQIAELSEEKEMRLYQKRDVVYKEGQYPRYLYFVVTGKLKGFLTNDMGKELVTHVYSAGDFIGHLALIKDEPYQDNVMTIEDAELRLIPREEFSTLLYSKPELSTQFIKMLAGEAQQSEQMLIELAYGTVRNKLATALDTLFSKYSENGQARFSILREDLAALAGTAKETIIRTLHDFKDEGLLKIVDNDIVIEDIDTIRNRSY